MQARAILGTMALPRAVGAVGASWAGSASLTRRTCRRSFTAPGVRPMAMAMRSRSVRQSGADRYGANMSLSLGV